MLVESIVGSDMSLHEQNASHSTAKFETTDRDNR